MLAVTTLSLHSYMLKNITTIVTTCTQNKIHYTSTLKNKIYAIKLTKTKTCMYKEKAAILKYRN